jgi:hypothetical protein
MRITVADVLGWLASGMKPQQILEDFPELTEQDIQACLQFAAQRERQTILRLTRLTMTPRPTEGYSITLRLRLANKPGVLGKVTSAIGVGGRQHRRN